jgi:two-component system KDP operon response regulator KdpE
LYGKQVLIVDDDTILRRLLVTLFSDEGCEVFDAASGPEALGWMQEGRPDLVILDVMMPGMDGWEVCPLLRELSDAPIIFLTALSEDEHVVRGLDCGAVDYVAKPFNPSVLRARARAALRQARGTPHRAEWPTYDDGYLTISLREGKVRVQGQEVRLTTTEYRVLAYLVENAGQTLTHQQILTHVWGSAYQDAKNYVHVYIRHLRKRIEPDPGEPRYLLTRRGVGYRFNGSGGLAARDDAPLDIAQDGSWDLDVGRLQTASFLSF